MVEDWLGDVEMVRGAGAPIDKRAAAARRLAAVRDSDVLEALNALATTDDLPARVAWEVGAAVATVAMAFDRLDGVSLHEFAEQAYLGYDEIVARASCPDGE
jgi:hypothetical protein